MGKPFRFLVITILLSTSGCAAFQFGWLLGGTKDGIFYRYEERPQVIDNMQDYLSRRSPAVAFLRRNGNPGFYRLAGSDIELFYLNFDQTFLFVNKPERYGSIEPVGPVPEELNEFLTESERNSLEATRTVQSTYKENIKK